MTPLEILRRAREIISNEAAWTQGTMRRDHQNLPVGFDDPRACKFCMIGAIMQADPDNLYGQDEATSMLDEAICGVRRQVRFVASWNDLKARTHSEVLAAFDKAIQKAEGA